MTRSLKRPYTGSKAVSGSCRGRDGCPVCVGNRTAKHERKTVETPMALAEEHLAAVEYDRNAWWEDDADCWCCGRTHCEEVAPAPLPPFAALAYALSRLNPPGFPES